MTDIQPKPLARGNAGSAPPGSAQATPAFSLDLRWSSGGSGLETAAFLHLCTAQPHLREPNHSLLRHQPFDVIVIGPFVPKATNIGLPPGPGLGVSLYRDRLAFCAELLRDRGVPDKYHDADAPGVMRRMPLV